MEDDLAGGLDGPWDCGFWCAVPLRARSKSNFRRSPGDRSWSRLSGFESQLALLVGQCVPDGWSLGDPEVPVASRPSVLSYLFAPTLLDSPNLPKSVFDALEGVVFHRDSSVRWCASGVDRCADGRFMFVAFAQMRETDPVVLARCFADLAAACADVLPTLLGRDW